MGVLDGGQCCGSEQIVGALCSLFVIDWGGSHISVVMQDCGWGGPRTDLKQETFGGAGVFREFLRAGRLFGWASGRASYEFD